MATTGPMLVTKLEVELRTSQNSACSCGRFSSFFYLLHLGWSGNPADKSETTCLCSWCAGERLQLVPHLIKPFKNSTFVAPGEPEFRECGKKLVLLPDPKDTLTDDERGDVVTYTRSSTEGGEEQAFNLREWALKRGTTGLQYRVSEGLDWERLAQLQWALEMARPRLPESLVYLEHRDLRKLNVKPRATPTEDEVATLLAAKAQWESVVPQVKAQFHLVWARQQGGEPHTELRVSVDLPTKGTRQIYFALPERVVAR